MVRKVRKGPSRIHIPSGRYYGPPMPDPSPLYGEEYTPSVAVEERLHAELVDVFQETRNVDESAASQYAQRVLERDQHLRFWLIGLRANAVEAVYLNRPLSQYEAWRIHSDGYNPKDTKRIRENIRIRPVEFVLERDEEWVWLHPRVRWVQE